MSIAGLTAAKKAVLCRIQRVFRRAVAPELYRRCAEPAAGIVNDEDYTEYQQPPYKRDKHRAPAFGIAEEGHCHGKHVVQEVYQHSQLYAAGIFIRQPEQISEYRSENDRARVDMQRPEQQGGYYQRAPPSVGQKRFQDCPAEQQLFEYRRENGDIDIGENNGDRVAFRAAGMPLPVSNRSSRSPNNMFIVKETIYPTPTEPNI